MNILEVVNGEKDFLVTNDINGEIIAVVLKGETQLSRLHTALQEEFSIEEVVITEVETELGSGISFTLKDSGEESGHSIKLLSAFIY